MAKEVNIPIKAEGAEQAKAKVDALGKSFEGLGDSVEQAGRKGAQGTDRASDALERQGGLLADLAGKAAGLLGAWKGVELIVSLLDKWADRLRSIRDLQQEIHAQSLSLLEAGQSLEVQTGTVGRQEDWAQYLSGLQKTGRLRNVGEALQIATAFDIATGAQGGVAANQKQLMDIVPMFGATGVSGAAGAQFIDYAGTAGIAPAMYQDFYAKVLAGFRSSKSKDFGQFLTGLQSGTTGMILQGASAENAISTYATALSVTKNEASAATLVEQMTRLSSGAYAKPREALEGFGGVAWGDVDADGQFNLLLQYAGNLPENQRVQLLTEAGFSPELAGGLSKIASPDTVATLARTRQSVGGASGAALRQQITAFEGSAVGLDRRLHGAKAEDVLRVQGQIGGWMARLQAAQDRVAEMAVRGEDRVLMPDDVEAHWVAQGRIYDDLEEIARQAAAAGGDEGRAIARRARGLQYRIDRSRGVMLPQVDDELPIISRLQNFRRQMAIQQGPRFEEEFQGIVNIYNNNVVYNRSEGQASPRVEN